AVVGLLLLFAGRALAAQPGAISGIDVFFAPEPGAEGIAFEKKGTMVIGGANGEVRRITADGTATVIANLGEPLAGITALRDGRILIAAFNGAGRVWSVDPETGDASVFATGIPGANFIVQARRGPIFVTASNTGQIFDIASGTPVERASGLQFPDGLAIGRG